MTYAERECPVCRSTLEYSEANQTLICWLCFDMCRPKFLYRADELPQPADWQI